MTSYTQRHTTDFVRVYRNMLNDLTRNTRMNRRSTSNSKIYNPATTVGTMEASGVFFPLFYSGEKGALGIWEKRIGMGFIKRRLDEEDHTFHVMELSNPRTNLGTYISAPKSALNALHITLSHLIIVMKNYRRNFAFDVLVMDSNAYRRRFSFATWYNPASLKKFSFMCQVPLRLEIGWNEIHIDFNELVKSTYKTSYVETIRVQIYANCKLRQVFFCDDKIVEGEIPIPSMRDFENIRIVPVDYGPRTHPDAIEHGPERKRDIPYVDPPYQVPLSRLEMDLKHLTQKRFNEVSKQRLMLQPYKTYFRDLLHEQKVQKKLAAAAIEAAARAEVVITTTVSSSNNNHDKSQSQIRPVVVLDEEKVPTLADVRDLLVEKQLKYPVDNKVVNVAAPPPPLIIPIMPSMDRDDQVVNMGKDRDINMNRTQGRNISSPMSDEGSQTSSPVMPNATGKSYKAYPVQRIQYSGGPVRRT